MVGGDRPPLLGPYRPVVGRVKCNAMGHKANAGLITIERFRADSGAGYGLVVLIKPKFIELFRLRFKDVAFTVVHVMDALNEWYEKRG